MNYELFLCMDILIWMFYPMFMSYADRKCDSFLELIVGILAIYTLILMFLLAICIRFND